MIGYLCVFKMGCRCLQGGVGARPNAEVGTMGPDFPVIMIVIGTLLVVVLAVVVISAMRGKKLEPDYFSWFWMGLLWLPLGILMAITQGNPGYWIFGVMGLVFLALGLRNRDKWRLRRRFGDLPPEEKQLKLFAIAAGVLMLILLIGAAYYVFTVLR